MSGHAWTTTELRDAAVAQWRRVDEAVAGVRDWSAPTRLGAWTTRELVGHLVLVGNFGPTLTGPTAEVAELDVLELMTGAPRRAVSNDERARASAAEAGDPADLSARLHAHVVQAADAGASLDDSAGTRVLATRFGAMTTDDFLLHRLVEGCVHGLDLPAPATLAPEERALAIAVATLAALLVRQSPGDDVELRVGGTTVRSAGVSPGTVAMQPVDWLELATGRTSWAEARASGRATGDGDLSGQLPVLS